MEDLAKAIDRLAEDYTGSPPPDSAIRAAAVKWAETSLRTLDDNLLKKALAISAAIADFCNELERKP